MEAVIWAAALICAAAYAALGAAGYSLFGQEVQGDLLANFGEESLGPILGGSAGAWFGAVAKAVYAGTLVVTFPVCNWGLRVNALELVSETPPGPGEGNPGWVVG